MTDKKGKHDYKKILKSLSKNYWAISTVVLAILLITTLLTGGLTGATVSPEEAGQNVARFANQQGANAEFISASDYGSLYEVIISIGGQEVPVYVTKDGKTLVPQPISLEIEEEEEVTPSESSTTEIPKADKPTVELFVMSYCPYGMKAQEIFYPVMDLLKQSVDFRVRFVYYAMHGEKEIEENFVQYCIQEEESDKYTSYLECFLTSQDSESCLMEANIDQNKIDNCIEENDNKFKITERYNDESTWLSGRFPLFDIEKDIGDKYGVRGSEAMIINGVTASMSDYRWSPENLKNLICDSFTEGKAPEECSQVISSDTESSGVTGQCG